MLSHRDRYRTFLKSEWIMVKLLSTQENIELRSGLASFGFLGGSVVLYFFLLDAFSYKSLLTLILYLELTANTHSKWEEEVLHWTPSMASKGFLFCSCGKLPKYNGQC